MKSNFSKVEQAFYEESGSYKMSSVTPYLMVDNFPKLGLLSALSFLEWVAQNPTGVASLPTGKTAGHFINYTLYLLENWNGKAHETLEAYGLGDVKKPDLRGLHLVQAGEFYPISSVQHNSLWNFIYTHYIGKFGFDETKSLLINSDRIALAQEKHFSEVFPDLAIDLSLRFREPKTKQEKLQQESIFLIDNWCNEYETAIRDKGGIGFFLGGIGPDGYIAFNNRGTNHYMQSRLTQTNFETQAVTAGDLGGIEVSSKRLVITIGLGTLTYNPDNKAIVFAAGEAIADVVSASIESEPVNLYPATAFQKLENARFYLTKGAAVSLTDSIERFYFDTPWNFRKTERAVIELCKRINKFGNKLTLDDLKNDKYCSHIPNLSKKTVSEVVESIESKIKKGMCSDHNQVFYHTGPHHDDIMLGIMPLTNRQSRDRTNEMHFAVMTSGYHAVTNDFLYDLLADTRRLMEIGKIEMICYPDFFESGYKLKWDKDVYHYLD
ncbi:MAG: glucosamine-6-phosphate isomerase, partial [Prolixibacteraceae bacterium]|nr:glucosamine-6-phosphate isomerase [Prolixibacteraceae bacterium]